MCGGGSVIAVPLLAPSKFELATTDVSNRIAADQPTWNVVRAATLSLLPAVFANAANHPTDDVPLVVVMRGSRNKAGDDPPKGTTQALWDVSILVALFVHDGIEATRPATLDAEEVKLINALNGLQADTDFGANARDSEVQGIDPLEAEADGDVPPFAGSICQLAAQVWE